MRADDKPQVGGKEKGFLGLGEGWACQPHHTQLGLASVIKTIITDLMAWLQL